MASSFTYRLGLISIVASMAVAIPAVADVGPQSPQNPDPTWEGRLLDPTEVPGKEYSDNPDTDMVGTPDPMQNLGFAGDGVNIWETFDYSIDATAGSGTEIGNPEFSYPVDGLANIRDFYFQDLVADRVSLLLSFEGVGDIHFQQPTHRGSGTGVWADASNNISMTNTPGDVDGLEIWGPEDDPNAFDANMFSIADDDADGRLTSIFKYNADTGESSEYISAALLASILINDNGAPANLTPEQINLDGMLVWDYDADDTFGEGDSIIFTIEAVETFDGGEIWVYNYGEDYAEFLQHGGITWNTNNEVGNLFGVGTEEINALEALPEPGMLGLMGLILIPLLYHRRIK